MSLLITRYSICVSVYIFRTCSVMLFVDTLDIAYIWVKNQQIKYKQTKLEKEFEIKKKQLWNLFDRTSILNIQNISYVHICGHMGLGTRSAYGHVRNEVNQRKKIIQKCHQWYFIVKPMIQIIEMFA